MTTAREYAPGAFDRVERAEAVVVGSGAAGLTAALGLAPRRVSLLTKGKLGEGTASAWAQGGVAAALGAEDSPAAHAADTVAAGAGACDAALAAILAREGPARIRELLRLGAAFDRDAEGALALGREAAHGSARILHAGGDATGRELVRVLTRALRAAEGVKGVEGVTVHEDAFAWELAHAEGRVVGVAALHPGGERVLHLAPAVVLATGGLGHAYLHTTNPPAATGDGVAMAARAGALVADLEFVQFHPTALATGLDPMPLLTEALRGEGARLVDGRGTPFMEAEHPLANLAPRDVIARAVWRRVAAGEPVFLDAREAVGERFPERFPTVFAHAVAAGIDPRHEPLPTVPAAHYAMGGVAVDARGRTSLPGLWACGEVASSGLHGANRLASNSLLEALVFGVLTAEDAAVAAPAWWLGRRVRLATPLPSAGTALLDPAEPVRRLRALMQSHAGVVREEAGLSRALSEISSLARCIPAAAGEARNLGEVARLVVEAALARRESRGSHYRSDYPATAAVWTRRVVGATEPSAQPIPLKEVA